MHKGNRFRTAGRSSRAPWSSLHRDQRPWLSTFVSPRILAPVPYGPNTRPHFSSVDHRAKPAGTPPTAAQGESSTGDRQSPAWPAFWQRVQAELRKAHFQTGTLTVYRQVLRQFSVFVKKAPSETAATDVNDYIYHLTCPHPVSRSRRPPARPSASPPAPQSSFLPPFRAPRLPRRSPAKAGSAFLPSSSYWLSVNISVLRTVLDKLGGLSVTDGIRTPKRPSRIPELLKSAEVERLIQAAPTLRDRLLIGVVYGCGLKVSEACNLKWEDVHLAEGQLSIVYAAGTKKRFVEFPPGLRPLLAAGVTRSVGTQYLFSGGKKDTHLTSRMAARIVKQAALTAGLPEYVTCMVLRHSHAVTQLRNGMTIRELQVRLGHGSIVTTLEYQRAILPAGIVSPADKLTLTSPVAPAPVPTVDLPSEAFELPADPVPDNPIAFSAELKTRLNDRFLAQRAAAVPVDRCASP